MIKMQFSENCRQLEWKKTVLKFILSFLHQAVFLWVLTVGLTPEKLTCQIYFSRQS